MEGVKSLRERTMSPAVAFESAREAGDVKSGLHFACSIDDSFDGGNQDC